MFALRIFWSRGSASSRAHEGSLMELVRQILSVSLVLVFLAAALLWLRRKGLAQFGGRPAFRKRPYPLEDVQRLRLTPNHALHLVRMADRALLVAVHSTGCTLLESLPWQELEDRTDEQSSAETLREVFR